MTTNKINFTSDGEQQVLQFTPYRYEANDSTSYKSLLKVALDTDAVVTAFPSYLTIIIEPTRKDPIVGKPKITNEQAKIIKTHGNVCGWSAKQIKSLLKLDMTDANIGRIKNGKRYNEVLTAGNILEIYPTIVNYTRNKGVGLEEELKDYCLGLSGEVGELNDIIKKMLYHGKEINPTDLMYELDDILYYLVAIGQLFGFDFDLISLNNNAKLMARYPDGFSTIASENRIEEQCLNNGGGDNR